jgi:hypothetical protein
MNSTNASANKFREHEHAQENKNKVSERMTDRILIVVHILSPKSQALIIFVRLSHIGDGVGRGGATSASVGPDGSLIG